MKKLFILTIIAIFLIPIAGIIPIKGVTVWYPQYIALLAILFAGVSCVLWKFNKYLAIFSFVCLLSTIFTAKCNVRTLIILFTIDLSFLGIYMISRFTKKQRKIIIWCILGLLIIQGVMICLQYTGNDPIFDFTEWGNKDATRDSTVGLSGSVNQLGVFLATVSPLVVAFCPYLLIIVILGLWCTTTSFAVVAFGIANLFFLFFTNRKFFYIFLGIFLISSTIFFVKFETPINKSIILNRIIPIKVAVQAVNKGQIRIMELITPDKAVEKLVATKVITCNPWLGFGLGSFPSIMPFYNSDKEVFSFNRFGRLSHLHNDIGEMYFELGRIGFIVFLLWLCNLLYRIVKCPKSKELYLYSSCLLAYFICSMGVFASHTAVGGVWGLLSYSFLEGVLNGQKTR